jgi:hypothetical protein
MIRKGIAVGIILLLFVGTSISVAYDTSTDEVPPQNINLFFLKHAFVWGTYEHRWKDWVLSFEIWNENETDLTIHVIGYGAYGTNDTYIWMNIEARQVYALRHLGIIGLHRCCMFAFGWLGVTVDGVLQ